MGFGTYLYSETYFSRENFGHKSEVEERIREVESYIQTLRERLFSFTLMTEPNKFCPENTDPLHWVTSETSEILDELEDSYVDLYRYRVLLDKWDSCHNEKGEAIGPPKEWGYESKAFMHGDFIKVEGENE